ncbi:MAG TPA: PAS domain S-box protein [Prolixibacteraceae bacterium]|nr:PAS domain S-box protein [Prolixibacteraceae bacterium]
MQAISRLKTNQSIQWQKERLSEARFFSANIPYSSYVRDIIRGNGAESAVLFRESLLQIMTHKRYENIFLLSKENRVLFQVYPDSLIMETATRTTSQKVFSSGKKQSTDVFFCTTHQQFHFDLIAPVFDDKENVLAVLLFRVNPHDYLFPTLCEWPTPYATTESYLVRVKDDSVEYISDLRQYVPHSRSLQIPLSDTENNAVKAAKGVEGLVRGENYRGDQVLSFVEKIPETSWILITEIALSDVYHDLYQIGILIILLSFFMVCFIGISVTWFYHYRQRNIYRELYSEREQVHQKQEELKESERKFRTLAENMSDVVWLSDLHFNNSFVSPSVEKLFGETPEDHMKRTLEEKFPPAALEKIKETMARVYENEKKPLPERTQNVSIETERYKADGTIIWVAMNITLLRDEQGKLIGLQGVTRDIDQQKRAELKLIEHERQLSSMISNLPGFVYRCNYDASWTMKFISNGCFKVTGYHPDDFIDNHVLSFNDIISPEYQDKLFQQWKNVLQEKGIFEAEYPIITTQKEIRWIWERGSGVFDPQGNLLFLEGYIEDITEREKAGEALRESERSYRELIDGMNETVWIIDFDGKLIDVNRTAIRELGYSKEELLSMGLFGIDSSLNREKIVALAHNMPVDQIQIFETRHRAKSGTIIPVEVYSSLINYHGNKAILSIARDITERKKAEEQISKERILLRTLIDHLPDAIYVKDHEGRKLAANAADFKMMRCHSEEEILRKTDREIYGEALGANGYLEDMTVIHSRKAMLNKEDSYFDPDGKLHWRSISKIPLFDNKGNVTGLVGFGRDITQQKQDENVQQILYQIARASMQIHNLKELLILVRDELGKIMDVTNFYVALYYPETDSLKKVLFVNERYSIEEWKISDTLSGQVIKSGKTLLLKNEEVKKYRNHQPPANFMPAKCWLGVPVLDDNHPIGVMVVQSYSDPTAYDASSARLLELIAHELSIVIQRTQMIHDLIAAKEKAEESDRLKSAFMANISHEIRTPMNGILGFLELLTEPNLSEDQKEMYLDIMNKSGQRLLDTINDIVEISRIEARQVETHISEVSITEVMEYHYQFFKTLAESKKLHLSLAKPHAECPTTVHTDKHKLDAILTNLLNNAVKYTQEGTIELGYTSAQDELNIYVRDTGIGIPPEKQESIFDRFIQADITITRPQEGTGLGLAIVKAYIEMLGGTIRVESEPGKGSAFFVTIPCRQKTQKP